MDLGYNAGLSTPKVKGARKGRALVTNRCDYIKHCIEKADTLPEHDWYDMISDLAIFEDGDKVIHQQEYC